MPFWQLFENLTWPLLYNFYYVVVCRLNIHFRIILTIILICIGRAVFMPFLHPVDNCWAGLYFRLVAGLVVRAHLRFNSWASTVAGKQCWLWAVRLHTNCDRICNIYDTCDLVYRLPTGRSITNRRFSAQLKS